jgi:hypothetical protein
MQYCYGFHFNHDINAIKTPPTWKCAFFLFFLYEASLYHHDCGGRIPCTNARVCVRAYVQRTLFSTFEEAPQKCEGRWAQWQTFSRDRTKNERIPEKVADDRHIATSKSKREREDGLAFAPKQQSPTLPPASPSLMNLISFPISLYSSSIVTNNPC